MLTVEGDEAKYMIEFRVVEEDGFDYIENAIHTNTLWGLRKEVKVYKKAHPEGIVVNVFEHNKFVNGEVMDEWCIEHITA